MAITLENTLELLIETWDDPGDYPSNAGSGPLPSYDYIAGIEGSLRLRLDETEIADLTEATLCGPDSSEVHDVLEELILENDNYPENVFNVSRWEYVLDGEVLEIEAAEGAEITGE